MTCKSTRGSSSCSAVKYHVTQWSERSTVAHPGELDDEQLRRSAVPCSTSTLLKSPAAPVPSPGPHHTIVLKNAKR